MYRTHKSGTVETQYERLLNLRKRIDHLFGQNDQFEGGTQTTVKQFDEDQPVAGLARGDGSGLAGESNGVVYDDGQAAPINHCAGLKAHRRCPMAACSTAGLM